VKIEHFRCYNALKHYLNFSEAAYNLHISQSTLSKQIRAMEDELGGVLFDRKHTTMQMTSLGQEIAPHVETILTEYDKMRILTKDFTNRKHHKLRVASLYEMAQYGITDIIVFFEQKQADFHVESRECDHSQMVSLLETNQTDIVIGYREFWPKLLKYNAIPLREDPLVLVVNEKSPIARKKSISLLDAKEEKFCFPREDATMFNFFCDSCAAFGFIPSLTLSDVRLDTIKRYIRAGMRSTLQVKTKAENFFYEPEFKIIELEKAPSLTLTLLYNEKKLDDMGEKFIEFASGYPKPSGKK
jgi:DNA-binding transcriptional LysR family regulator